MTEEKYFPRIEDVSDAADLLKEIIEPSPTSRSRTYSNTYNADIYFKEENLQIVRSYKIRGAYNMIRSLDNEVVKKGIVCASAGNHAQGVAYSCNKLKIMGTIYMPMTTPRQKIEQVHMFGEQYIDIVLIGDSFDESNNAAKDFAQKSGKTFIPPFDDPKIIEGQGTIGLEILEQIPEDIDYVFIPIGGGGLASGVGSVIKTLSPNTKIIGVEPAGAACMKAAIEKGEIVKLETIDKFVDGAAVKQAGHLTYEICKDVLDDIIAIPEGAVCTTIIELYNKNAIVVEPAGALSIAALRFYKEEIKNKRVVCIISGSNNDIMRMEEIREKSLIYEGLKHYFIVNFAQRSGALLAFTRDILSPSDNLEYFQYMRKSNKEEGPALVGVQVANKEDFKSLIRRMDANNINYEYINENNKLFEILI